MRKFHTLLFLFICIANSHLTGQIIPSIPSPTAANLGLYGEIPVSYYTGTPNISIPLYEIKGKHVNIPISLTYHPSAIRPEIHPGPTGLGWTLQAGGVITRIVKGAGADDGKSDGREYAVQGYYQYAKASILSPSNWKSFIENAMNRMSQCHLLTENMAYTDLEPDEFSFNFLGMSGKFYIHYDGSIKVQSDHLLSVDFTGTHNDSIFIDPKNIGFYYGHNINSEFQPAFRKFVITDAHGNRYYFGGDNAIEFSDPIYYSQGIYGFNLHATSWYLIKIESADGSDIINFEYERGPFISHLYKGQSFFAPSYGGTRGLLTSGNFISPVYLRTIKCQGGEVLNLIYSKSNDLSYEEQQYRAIISDRGGNFSDDDFALLYSSSVATFHNTGSGFDRIMWLKLDTIAIYNIKEDIIRQVLFTYDESATKRLLLQKLNVYGNTLSNVQPFSFSYKNSLNIPAYLASITDHWGFNNNKLYDGADLDIATFSNNRTVVPSATQNGILSAIKFPTGGSVFFEYEQHKYSKVVNTKNRKQIDSIAGNAGGVRIKKIITNDGQGQEKIKEYTYGVSPSSTVSSGVLNVMPVYGYSFKGINCYTDNDQLYAHYRSDPIIPLTKGNDGLYIGYTDVCEHTLDGGNTVGYTRYTFTNHDNGYCDSLLADGRWRRDGFPENPHCSRFFERGRLIKEQQYNSNGVLVQKRVTEWMRYGSQSEDSNPRAIFFDGYNYITGTSSNSHIYLSAVYYLHYTYKFLRSRQIDSTSDATGQNPVVSTTNYTYTTTPNGLLSSEEKISSDNQRIKTTYRYANDVGDSGMVAKNMIGIPIETVTFRNERVIDAVVQPYRTVAGNLQLSFQAQLETNNAISNYANYSSSQMDVRMKNKLTYDLYDSKGNLLQATASDGIITSFVWGYKYQYPIAKITGATYAELKTALGRSDDPDDLSYLQSYSDTQLTAELKKLRQNLPNAQVSTYTYSPQIGLTSETAPNGTTTYYEYDDFRRLRTIKDHFWNILQQYKYKYGGE